MPPIQLTRRSFLRLAALAGIGITGLVLDRATQPMGLSRAARWLLSGEVMHRFGTPAIVGLGKCNDYNEREIYNCLLELWNQAEMPDVSGKSILVKPNLIDFIDPHPINTAPQIIGALLDLLDKLGAAEIVVGEGSGFRRDLGAVAGAIGLTSVLEKRNISLIDLNYDDPGPVLARGGWFIKTNKIWLPRHVRKADLIVSLPKLKTHHWSGVSLSLKNLFGVIPGTCYGWPKNFLHVNGIPLSILGVYQTLPQVISVVDGIIGMEGDGPLYGNPVNHNLLAIGSDPVAVDTLCANLMGFTPDDVFHLFLANWAGVGQGEKIIAKGISPDLITIPYKKPPTP